MVVRVPSGYSFSPGQQGGNPALDSDVTNSSTGETGTFTMTSGQVRTDIDAGLYQGVCLDMGMVWSGISGAGA